MKTEDTQKIVSLMTELLGWVQQYAGDVDNGVFSDSASDIFSVACYGVGLHPKIKNPILRLDFAADCIKDRELQARVHALAYEYRGLRGAKEYIREYCHDDAEFFGG